MPVKFGQEPLASLMAPAFETSTPSNRPLLQSPCNVHMNGTLRRYSEGN